MEEIWTETDVSIRENYLVVGLLMSVGLLVSSGIPHIGDNFRYFFLQVGTFLVLLLLGTCRDFQERLLPALRRLPNPFILLLGVWTVFAFYNSPYRNFAATELLRIVSGIGVYFLAAYSIKSPRQVSVVMAGLLLMGVFLSLIDFAEVGARGGQRVLSDQFSVLGTHEHVGSVLTLLFPVALVFALHTGIEEKRRLAATAVTLVLGASLLVSRSRSGWLATLLALVVLAALYVRYIRPEQPEEEDNINQPLWQRLILSPIFQVVIALVVFLALTGIATLVMGRAAHTFKIFDDAAFKARLAMWNGASLMISEKPLTGWGLGAFPVLQGQFTHSGDDTMLVLAKGTSHDNNAHNYYLQWGVETGLTGIFLHIAVLSSFLFTCLRGLAGVRTPFQTALLAGTIAAVLASLVDSLSSPMYHFAGIWAILYTWMGLGIAGIRPIPMTVRERTRYRRTSHEEQKSDPLLRFLNAPAAVWIASLSISFLVVAGMFLGARYTIHSGTRVPRGTFQLVSYPVGPVTPGSPVSWRATYTDEHGVTCATLPGTRWYFNADQSIVNQAQQELLALHEGEREDQPPIRVAPDAPLQSVFRILLPLSSPPHSIVTIKATYMDRFGRTYQAWSSKEIVAPSKKVDIPNKEVTTPPPVTDTTSEETFPP
jgi:O-antigen ligase